MRMLFEKKLIQNVISGCLQQNTHLDIRIVHEVQCEEIDSNLANCSRINNIIGDISQH